MKLGIVILPLETSVHVTPLSMEYCSLKLAGPVLEERILAEKVSDV